MRSCFWLALAVGCTSSQSPTAYLDPSEPRTTDDLTVFFESGSGGGTSWTFHWFKDGQRMPELNGSTVSAEHTAKNEVWQVALIPDDISAWSLEGGSDITGDGVDDLVIGAQRTYQNFSYNPRGGPTSCGAR